MKESLEFLRQKIIRVDEEILTLAQDRIALARKIGKIKKSLRLPIEDLPVEREVLEHSRSVGKKLGLENSFTDSILRMLIAQSVKSQQDNNPDTFKSLYHLFERAEAFEALGKKIIRLEVGEPDFQVPKRITDVGKRALGIKRISGYVSSQGLKELRTALAKETNDKHQTKINSEQVLVTPGGKFAIFAAILGVISNQGRAIVIDPSWPVYEEGVQLAGGRLSRIHTTLKEDWSADLGTIEAAAKAGSKLLVLNNPCNPTGKILSKKELECLADIAQQYNLVILSDEVYSAYAFRPFCSVLDLANVQFIYINSFSKRYGMTGWRVGYAISNTRTISRMQRILQASVTCVPGFIQKAALAALKARSRPFDSFANQIKRRVDVACTALDDIPVDYNRPEGAMYVFPRARKFGFNSFAFATELLEKKKVAIAPGLSFGDYPEHFRLSMTASPTEIKRGIRLIGQHLSTFKEN
ncbi:MAG: aminotransferase class I/II-fold pyridoxal phosphate-dependent enzyme [Candidatus Bathyarchaeia archaeon]